MSGDEKKRTGGGGGRRRNQPAHFLPGVVCLFLSACLSLSLFQVDICFLCSQMSNSILTNNKASNSRCLDMQKVVLLYSSHLFDERVTRNLIFARMRRLIWVFVARINPIVTDQTHGMCRQI